jgi:DNA-directed RNA polymerase subunit beta
VNQYLLRNLDKDGIVLVGAWVEPGDVLVGKITPQELIGSHPESKLLQAIFGAEAVKTKDTSFKVPLRAGGRVIDVRWVCRDIGILKQNKIIRVSILQKRKIKIGDKIAGRHGNKGIISKILAKQNMPYLQNGTPVDMVLSPLGVPSRMNVGQVLECVLGLAGTFLNKHYRIMPFDERYERGASRKLVFSELYECSQNTDYPWLFEYDTPGKNRLFDGRNGEMFDQSVTVGRAYMFKLIHQADDKIHARSTGPYALVTQQPLRGKSRQGGQRVGEMEVWALQGFGAAHVLQEILLIKSDHVMGRSDAFSAITSGQIIPKPLGAQDSLKLLIRELYCLGIKIEYSSISRRNLMRQQNDI